MREIQCICALSSTSVVDYHLKNLERLGFIRRHYGVSRGIDVTTRMIVSDRYDELMRAAKDVVQSNGNGLDNLARAIAKIEGDDP